MHDVLVNICTNCAIKTVPMSRSGTRYGMHLKYPQKWNVMRRIMKRIRNLFWCEWAKWNAMNLSINSSETRTMRWTRYVRDANVERSKHCSTKHSLLGKAVASDVSFVCKKYFPRHRPFCIFSLLVVRSCCVYLSYALWTAIKIPWMAHKLTLRPQLLPSCHWLIYNSIRVLCVGFSHRYAQCSIIWNESFSQQTYWTVLFLCSKHSYLCTSRDASRIYHKVDLFLVRSTYFRVRGKRSNSLILAKSVKKSY